MYQVNLENTFRFFSFIRYLCILKHTIVIFYLVIVRDRS